jgi:hypothetical protein
MDKFPDCLSFEIAVRPKIVNNFLGWPFRTTHEVFVNMLTSKYLGVASFGDNPFSHCEPTTKKHWWQFWK